MDLMPHFGWLKAFLKFWGGRFGPLCAGCMVNVWQEKVDQNAVRPLIVCFGFDLECKPHYGSNLWLVDDLLARGSTSAAASRLLRFVRPHRVILVAANVSN